MYNLLISLLSPQSIPLPFRICINLVQFTRSNTFCLSMKHARNSSSMSKARSDIILSIPIAPPVPFPLLNPNWFSASTSSTFLSVLQSILVTIFDVHAMRLILRRSLHFVSFRFFFKTIIVTSEILRSLSSLIYSADHLCHYSVTTFSQQSEYISTYITSCSLLIHHLLDTSLPFTAQNIRSFLVCIYFFFKFDF